MTFRQFFLLDQQFPGHEFLADIRQQAAPADFFTFLAVYPQLLCQAQAVHPDVDAMGVDGIVFPGDGEQFEKRRISEIMAAARPGRRPFSAGKPPV